MQLLQKVQTLTDAPEGKTMQEPGGENFLNKMKIFLILSKYLFFIII